MVWVWYGLDLGVDLDMGVVRVWYGSVGSRITLGCDSGILLWRASSPGRLGEHDHRRGPADPPAVPKAPALMAVHPALRAFAKARGTTGPANATISTLHGA